MNHVQGAPSSSRVHWGRNCVLFVHCQLCPLRRLTWLGSTLGTEGLCVEDFHAGLSEGRKDDLWSQFRAGNIRILISTAAASIGRNDRGVGVATNAHLSESLAGVSQRWGRGGRSSTITCNALCLQLAPSRAFRSTTQTLNTTLARVQGAASAPSADQKRDTVRREILYTSLEEFINVTSLGLPNSSMNSFNSTLIVALLVLLEGINHLRRLLNYQSDHQVLCTSISRRLRTRKRESDLAVRV